MELKNTKVPEKIMLKLNKLKALAERGVGGEADNAKKLLSSICEKYGVDEASLFTDEEKWYSFRMKSTLSKLFLQVYVSIYGTTEKYLNGVKFYRYGKDKVIECLFTQAEYIEFSQLWEWHKSNYSSERRRMKKLFELAYIEKFHLYPNQTCEQYEEECRNKKDKQYTMEDIYAISSMASACQNKSFRKQIEE